MINPLRWFTDRIGGKIILPYLILVFLLGLLATYVVMTLVSTSLADKVRLDLADGGRAANEGMLKMEDQHLSILRQMLFTTGVDEAILQRDAPALQQLLGPIQVNSKIGYVDVFDATGQQVFALRPLDREADALSLVDPDAGAWAPVLFVVRGEVDELGDKSAGLVHTSWGEDLVVWAGPVKKDEQVVGIIAIGMPLPVIVARLSQETVSGISIYDESGLLAATSVAAMGRGTPVDPTDLQSIRREGRVVLRPMALPNLDVVEILGTLTIRQEPAAVLGVSKPINIINDTGTRTRDVMIAIFSAVVFLVLVLGLWLARQLTRPIDELVAGTERIQQGDLSREVAVISRDETGLLAREFNHMIGGLRERDKARDAFGRYFSDDFYALVQQGRLELGGEERDITVLLSDIRSFTTLSEGLTPTDLVHFLNEYFELQVAAIKRHGGEVDKYMGDAILAKFGAPVWYPDHARRAVLAMLDMRAALSEFNERLQARGDFPIRIGIGANTGPAIVGNIGSQARMEYTIIGDTVNTTQRIEDLCKELRTDLLISETVYSHVTDLIEVGEPHAIVLRGRSQETLVYPLVGLMTPSIEADDGNGHVVSEHVSMHGGANGTPVSGIEKRTSSTVSGGGD